MRNIYISVLYALSSNIQIILAQPRPPITPNPLNHHHHPSVHRTIAANVCTHAKYTFPTKCQANNNSGFGTQTGLALMLAVPLYRQRRCRRRRRPAVPALPHQCRRGRATANHQHHHHRQYERKRAHSETHYSHPKPKSIRTTSIIVPIDIRTRVRRTCTRSRTRTQTLPQFSRRRRLSRNAQRTLVRAHARTIDAPRCAVSAEECVRRVREMERG